MEREKGDKLTLSLFLGTGCQILFQYLNKLFLMEAVHVINIIFCQCHLWDTDIIPSHYSVLTHTYQVLYSLYIYDLKFLLLN
jgi:hypothetical protein